ncbi:MAG: PUCC protein [Chloroflexi bacterium RBG_16_57_11]|nr:MAG: PUCC protein [Chloroflexi bacterium RBG_16_57_11]
MIRKRIQLGMLHIAVAMTLVPINSTLNRVMIKELAISATLVALLASLPYLFSPIQVAIGSFSDRHPIAGLRRSPYILLGLVMCVLGVTLSPQAAFLMATNLPVGIALGVLAFGAWGMGFNFATVSYLSLASELSGESGRGRTIAVMWFMMITSIILTAIGLSQMIDPYTPQALMRAFWAVGLAALIVGLLGLVGLEARSKQTSPGEGNYSWSTLARFILDNRQARIFFVYLVLLLAALLGQDILLEPFGGEAFGLTVQQTTRITSIWGVCVLAALLVAGALESRVPKRSVAAFGGWGALVGFVLIALSGVLTSSSVFYSGVVLLGVGTGLSTVSNLSLMLDMTTADKVGLFIGAWGMANALSRLLGSVLGGAVRDLVAHLTQQPVISYVVVFGVMALIMLVSLILLRRINVKAFQQQAEASPALVERAAMAGDPG